MGEYREVEPGAVRVSQDFVKEGTVAYILKCYKDGDLEKLPPPPVVRESGNELIAIDGHNLLVIDDLQGRKTKVYVASSADDALPGDAPGSDERNADLKEKFDGVLAVADELRQKGLGSVRDLRMSVPNLRTVAAAKEQWAAHQ